MIFRDLCASDGIPPPLAAQMVALARAEPLAPVRRKLSPALSAPDSGEQSGGLWGTLPVPAQMVALARAEPLAPVRRGLSPALSAPDSGEQLGVLRQVLGGLR
ncbi:hypothetical protein Aple_094150 [Acrocarpospora pleiomorpha]|uniref:Uncharacterized protein n=1 Tax=Acrocarpospora pleiomorpha TaxID=90975 RepID=A0A5M3XZZ6_9ACTN|nr:hypothetical protein Aple_094150 [Acrocarpospora pleiomorpha]